MFIEVRARGFQLSFALREHAIRSTEFALDRFEGNVDRVRIRLEDVNGPRGGVDKRCRIVIEGRDVGLLQVEALDLDLYAAIDAAASRAARRLKRILGRQHASFAHRGPALAATG